MTELLRHPRTMKKLQKELRRITNGNPDITEYDLEKFPYLKAVIKETLRLHPLVPLFIPREARSDVKVMGYNIAARTMLIVNACAIGRDPTAWDAPEEFRLERFLAHDFLMIDVRGNSFQLIPFGSSRRGRPGITFAVVINKLDLAILVSKFDWELSRGVKGEDLDTIENHGTTIRRELSLLVVANPRSFKSKENHHHLIGRKLPNTPILGDGRIAH
ncbi:unspecific monooxygenase, partial [Sarracenia purpurea var. burkii]